MTYLNEKSLYDGEGSYSYYHGADGYAGTVGVARPLITRTISDENLTREYIFREGLFEIIPRAAEESMRTASFSAEERDGKTVYSAEFPYSYYEEEGTWSVRYTVEDGYLTEVFLHCDGEDGMNVWREEITVTVSAIGGSVSIDAPEIVSAFDTIVKGETARLDAYKVVYVLIEEGVVSEYEFRSMTETDYWLTCSAVYYLSEADVPEELPYFRFQDEVDGFPVKIIALRYSLDGVIPMGAKKLVIPASVADCVRLYHSEIPEVFFESPRDAWDDYVVQFYIESDVTAYFAGAWHYVNGIPTPLS